MRGLTNVWLRLGAPVALCKNMASFLFWFYLSWYPNFYFYLGCLFVFTFPLVFIFTYNFFSYFYFYLIVSFLSSVYCFHFVLLLHGLIPVTASNFLRTFTFILLLLFLLVLRFPLCTFTFLYAWAYACPCISGPPSLCANIWHRATLNCTRNIRLQRVGKYIYLLYILSGISMTHWNILASFSD